MIQYGIFLAILAMFGFGISNGISKIPASKFSYQQLIFIRNIFSSVIIFIALLFSLKDAHFDLKYIIFTFFLSIIGYLSLVFLYKALKEGAVGIVSPVANSSTLITILLALIFFKEKLNIIQIIAVFFILLGIVLISINFKLFRKSNIFNTSSGVPYALLTCLFWGVFFFLTKIPVEKIGPIFTGLINEFGILVCCYFEIKIKKTKNLPTNSKDLFNIFMLAFLASMAVIFYNYAIRISSVSLVSAITFSSPLVAVIFGRIVFKDKMTTNQYIAIFLIFLGIVSLSYFK